MFLGAMSFPLTLTWRSGNNLCSKQDLPLRWATMVPMEVHIGDGEMEWERELNAFQDNDLFKYFLFLNYIFVR
jgi:hypothetical protein